MSAISFDVLLCPACFNALLSESTALTALGLLGKASAQHVILIVQVKDSKFLNAESDSCVLLSRWNACI